MSSAQGTFSGRSNQALQLNVTITNNGANSTASWALYYVRNSGTGSFTNSPTGSWAVNIGGNTASGAGPAYNLQSASSVLVASGAFAVPNGAVLYSSASASGVNLLGNASLSAADAVGPGAPSTPSLTSTPSTIAATWTDGGNGGAGITSHRIYYGTDPALAGASYVDTGSGTPAATITGLTPGQLYYVAVYAQNALGFGPRSGIASVRVGIGGKRWDGSAEVPFSQAMRWDGTQEVPITTAVRWDGTQEVPIS